MAGHLWTVFYMTAISITTVGYGELKPLSDGGRLFTVFLIFIGLGSAAVLRLSLQELLLKTTSSVYFGESKMFKRITNLKNHYIICGFGGIGSSISSVLYEADIPFVVIENNDETAAWAQKANYLTVIGKATYDETLLQAGIKKAAGIVVSMGDDSLNMYVSLAARELKPDLFIIARGYKSDIENRLLRAGADEVVYPLRMGGIQIAREIMKQFKKNFITDSDEIKDKSVMGYKLKRYIQNNEETVTVGEIKKKTGSDNVLLLKREESEDIHTPADAENVIVGDTLLLLISEDKSGQKIKL